MEFQEAYDLTLTWEGGGRLHTVAGDPGGTTRFGLSQRAYPHLDMPSLTLPKARFYAKRDYWDVVRADELPPELRWQVFDTAFNQGTGTASRILQKAVNLCRQAHGRIDFLQEDGVIGPKTLEAVDEQRPERLRLVFKAYRVEHYLVVAETRLPMFIHGWLRRAEGEPNA